MTDTNKEREAFERAYAEAWHAASSPRKESVDELQYEVSTWRDGDSYPGEMPRLRFGWEWWQARASLAASAGSEPAHAVEPFAWYFKSPARPGEKPLVQKLDWKPRNQNWSPLYLHPSPPEGAGWISVDERLPELYKRVLVITTDCDDEPYATPAHYNGPGKFLAAGGHRLDPVTHWQEIDAPPAGWKLPPAKPRVSHRRKGRPPLPASEAKGAT